MDLSLRDLQEEVREVNEANGWYEGERTFGDDVALLHSEVSEMFEAFRDDGLSDSSGLQFTSDQDYGVRSPLSARAVRRFQDARISAETGAVLDAPFAFERDELMALARDGISKPEGVGSEAADVLIRLLDTCERNDIDIVWEVLRKLAYNRTRGHRHGGKRI